VTCDGVTPTTPVASASARHLHHHQPFLELRLELIIARCTLDTLDETAPTTTFCLGRSNISSLPNSWIPISNRVNRLLTRHPNFGLGNLSCYSTQNVETSRWRSTKLLERASNVCSPPLQDTCPYTGACAFSLQETLHNIRQICCDIHAFLVICFCGPASSALRMQRMRHARTPACSR
jgi:hypothetical protein